MNFENAWSNQARAESYSKLEFPNTYYLAYRDLPEIISRYITGNRAIDLDKRPVEDIFWSVDDYKKLFDLAGLEIEATYKPLGYDDEPFNWVSEKKIAPWMIFVLKKSSILNFDKRDMF